MHEYLTSPLAPAFLAYVFGRFLLGYWVARQGYLTAPQEHQALFDRLRGQLLLAGLALSILAYTVQSSIEDLPMLLNAVLTLLFEAGKLILAAAYALWLMYFMRSGMFQRLSDGLAAVGRMALSNYLAQTLIYLFVLYGFGLGLLTHAGATFCLGLSIVAFAIQIAVSHWWLARYRFGPAEYLWRWATYGRRPA